jgi:hypothetical protein
MDNKSRNKVRSGSRRVILALASCALGAVLILSASKMGSRSEDGASGKAPSTEVKKKPSRSWNIALGNVVVVAPDLGFNAKVLKGGRVEESRIAARLESQLQGLREFYREESESDPSLMGGMLLQISVNSSGEVTHVKELVSRITDNEFKQAVLAEVSKWTFPEIIAETTTINCPLLFVREGMDITTVVQWEKTLGQFTEKSAVAKMNAQAAQESQVAEAKNAPLSLPKLRRRPVKSKPSKIRNPSRFLVCIKSSIPLRFARHRTSTPPPLVNSRRAPRSTSLQRAVIGSRCERTIPA